MNDSVQQQDAQQTEAITDAQLKKMHDDEIIMAINESIEGLARATKDTQHIEVPIALLNSNTSAPLKPSNVVSTLMMFYHTAYLISQSRVTNEIPAHFKNAFNEHFTEKSLHIMNTYAQYGLLREFLADCHYPNFSFVDMYAPSFQRYKAQLHSISNFLWFREATTEHLYTVLTAYKNAYTQIKPTLETSTALKAGIGKMTDEIVKLREIIAQLPARVSPLFQRYNQAMESKQHLNEENNKLTNNIMVLTNEISDLSNQLEKLHDEYKREQDKLVTKKQSDALDAEIKAEENQNQKLRSQHEALTKSVNVLEQYNNSIIDVAGKISDLITIGEQYGNDSEQLQAQVDNIQNMKKTIVNLNVQIETSKQEIANINSIMHSGSSVEQVQDNPSLLEDKAKKRQLTEECANLEEICKRKLSQIKELQDEINEEAMKKAKIQEAANEKVDRLTDKANEMMSAFIAQIAGMVGKLDSFHS